MNQTGTHQRERPLWLHPLAWLAPAFIVLGLTLTPGCGGSEPEAETTTSSKADAKEDHHSPEWPETDDPALAPGLAVFAEVCYRCHIESEYAPTLDDNRGWTRRIRAREKDGAVARDVFVKHAIEGFGDMEARGGRRGKHLTDEQIADAVDYMLWAYQFLEAKHTRARPG
ncbi:MAG: c-type cytochrome [Planctomycetota bacterium]